jgi:serine/threonine-protein kinase
MEEVGRGGMGVVYRARQVGLERTVALKMILAGAHAGPQDLLRFRREAEAVARLAHPNIVQIHEIGEQDGLPYFSLEYCDGGSLEKQLAGTPLPPAQAAALVETLARAVEAAHQQGVIHRDLKPGNVLLSAACGLADPKITDFGLAKRLEDAPGQTQTGAILGTPSYMAPEQAEGRKDVGAPADVYALGAILYECLTGRPPFKAATPLDTVLQVLHNEPVPPRQFQPKLPHDLEIICLKCLQKDQPRRYGSAQALAEDLERFRAGRAVIGRPVGRAERAWRWCRRNPVVAALTAAVVVALLGGSGGAAYFAVQARAGERQARDEKERADEEATEARRQEALARASHQRAETSYRLAREGLEECLRSVRDDPRLQRGDLEDLRRAVLQAEVRFYKKFLRLRGDDLAFQLERGRASLHLGWLTSELGDREEAIRHYRQGLAVFAVLARDHPGTPEYRSWLARGSNDLGVLSEGTGQWKEAERLLQQAIAVQEALARDWPRVPAARFDLAKHRGNLGGYYQRLGMLDQAQEQLRAARDLFRALAREQPRQPEYRAQLAHTCNNLGLLAGTRREPAEAERLLHEALVLHRALVREHPGVASYQDGLALTYRELGDLHSATRRPREAERTYRDALALQKALVRDHPALPGYRASLAETTHKLGWLYVTTGRPKEAEPQFRDALALRRALVRVQPTSSAYRADLADTSSNLALLLRNSGRPAEAEVAFREAVTLWEGLRRDFPGVRQYALDLGGMQCDLGGLLRKAGRPADSLAWYGRAIATLGAVLAREPRQPTARQFLRNAHHGRAEALTRLGRHTEALKDWDRALDLEHGPRRGWFRLQRAVALARAKDPVRATTEAEDLARAKEVSATTCYDLACVFALSAASAGNPRQAEACATRAVELLRQAVARGYQDASHVKQDADLDALRSRDDFRLLLRELAQRK